MAELVGIGFCLGEDLNDLFYIPIAHQSQKNELNQLSIEDIFSNLRSWIENPDKEKTLQNCKFDRQIFYNHGLNLRGVTFDTLLADYILNNQEKHGLSEISLENLDLSHQLLKKQLEKIKIFHLSILMMQVFTVVMMYF